MSFPVNVDNFVRAETDRMFTDIQRDAGGVNVLQHKRTPAPIDEQTVIRLNRDTLYSFAVVDLRAGVTLTLPDADGRYLSAMIVSNDHFVTDVLHEPGDHVLDEKRVGTRYAMIGVRILVDPSKPEDVAAVGALQDRVVLSAGEGEHFVSPDYETASFDGTRDALLALASGLLAFDRMFGRADEVDPVRHLIGAAAGWGGLPTSEAAYVGVEPKTPDVDNELVLRDVPVDAFWSVSVYDAQGFFEPNEFDRYTINSELAEANADGSWTIRFVHGAPQGVNDIPVPAGWNVLVRFYRPRPAFFAGSWALPELTPATR